MQLTLTPAQLRELITTVSPFADRSGFLPEFGAIRLQSADGVVTATATDRYVLGKVQVEVPGAGDFSALIDRAHCAELVKLFKVERRAREPKPVILTVSDDNLTATQPGAVPEYTVTVPLVNTAGNGFNSADGLLDRLLRQKSEPASVTLYNPANLSRFSHLGNELMVRATKEGQAVVVLAPRFVGLIMPLRTPRGSRSMSSFIESETARWLPAEEAVA